MDIQCPYSEHIKKGMRQYKNCTLIKQMCPFIRMCGHKNQVIHTPKAKGCELRLKQDKINGKE